MIVKDETLKHIRSAFSLNIYEVKIWTALLSKGVATAGELSELGEVPRSRSYDVLESLEKKGFVVMKLGKPIKYIAVSPDEILKRVKQRLEKKTQQQIKALKEVKSTDLFKELALLYKQGIDHLDPVTLAGSVKGRTNLYAHIDSMLRRAKKDVTIVTTEQGLLRKGKRLKNTMKGLAQKGVKIKVIAPITDLNQSIANQMAEYATMQNTTGMNARLVIIDGKESVFMLSDDSDVHENYDTGVWINTPYFAKMLHGMIKS
ncbi:hypothetical protein CL622_02730 [archaeon]|nr:hypothetical protein [archaeon]|tara:strand:+ start:1575 stop:2354 length:780 start_codon:yes stop_codon:yes gene_type:complete